MHNEYIVGLYKNGNFEFSKRYEFPTAPEDVIDEFAEEAYKEYIKFLNG